MHLHKDFSTPHDVLSLGISLSGDSLGIEIWTSIIGGRVQAIADTPAFAFDAALVHKGVALAGGLVHRGAAAHIGAGL
jgi:hypothetical protein